MMLIITWRCSLLFKLFDFIRAHKFLTGYGLLLIFSLWPTRFSDVYDAVPAERIFDELVQRTTPNMSIALASANNLTACSYHDTIATNRFLYTSAYRSELVQPADIRPGGEYAPADCRPLFSTAIIVVYRQRERQLDAFLIYIHNYLRRQRLHYRIFVVEQFDARPFNRAKLFNIGFVFAKREGFPCAVLHDVDLMPMRLGQLYACTKQPRHMCASLDEFRFNLPYRELFGGAIAIRTEQFAHVNGMSNMFQGWGGEDDDLSARLRAKKMEIWRFPGPYSQYAMLPHRKEPKSAERLMYLRTGPQRFSTDGLNSLRFHVKERQNHPLFTHILVET